MSSGTKMDTDAPGYLIRDGEAATYLIYSKATIWRRVANGTIPRPLKIGGMRPLARSEIIAVIEQAKSHCGGLIR